MSKPAARTIKRKADLSLLESLSRSEILRAVMSVLLSMGSVAVSSLVSNCCLQLSMRDIVAFINRVCAN